MKVLEISKKITQAFKYRFNRSVMKFLPVGKRFERIYRHRQWGGAESESRSGRGSSLAATENIRDEIPKLLKKLKVQTLLDLGCGDFHWMKHVDLSGFNYIGADLVQEVIDENRKNYDSQDRRFILLDGIVDALPADVDAVLCREVIFHLSFRDGLALIRNLCSSDAVYLIATQMDNASENQDIYTGGYRALDLTKAPYHFPAPIEVIPDNAIAANRSLCVWRLSEIAFT